MEKPDLYVVARLMDILHNSQGPLKKTNLQMMSRQNYPRFAEYLAWLVEHGLVTTLHDGANDELVILSPKGEESRRKLVGWITETMQDFRI